MVQYTNKYKLPDPIFRAISNDPYFDGGSDISTTRLISPPQAVALQYRYKDKIIEDISEKIWILIGQAIHVILERAGEKAVAEKRFFCDVNGWKLSGAIDLLTPNTIVDYKVTSVWTYLYKSRIKEWSAQGNVNRWLYHKNGGKANKLTNILILRNWFQSAAGSGNYPPVQIVSVDLPTWPLEETETYIRERITLHQIARTLDDDHLTPCTHEERWWNDKKKIYVRCESYCNVASLCKQNQKEKNHEII